MHHSWLLTVLFCSVLLLCCSVLSCTVHGWYRSVLSDSDTKNRIDLHFVGASILGSPDSRSVRIRGTERISDCPVHSTCTTRGAAVSDSDCCAVLFVCFFVLRRCLFHFFIFSMRAWLLSRLHEQETVGKLTRLTDFLTFPGAFQLFLTFCNAEFNSENLVSHAFSSLLSSCLRHPSFGPS